jgi:hypothetical protein
MGIFIKFCRHTQIVITVGRTEEARDAVTYTYNKLGYLHYHGYTSYQFYSCCCGYLDYYCYFHYKVYQDSLSLLWNSVTIVTLVNKVTNVPYGFYRSLCCHGYCGYHGYLLPLAALVTQMRLMFFTLRNFPILFLF